LGRNFYKPSKNCEKQTTHIKLGIHELRKICSLKSYDYLLKQIQNGRVCAKTIQKWHLNVMIKDVTESVDDFIQGRASTTVGSTITSIKCNKQ
jgi:intergrase/recombinase